MTTLAPSARLALDRVAELGRAPIETVSPEQARTDILQTYAVNQNPHEDVASVEEIFVGDLRLKVWCGKNTPVANAPALLHLHGGGWVVGSIETHEDVSRSIANRANAIVVAPDYRLAPEHAFPAGLDDCIAALKYMRDNSDRLGIDPERIAVGGDSAGGNLAAAVALSARDAEDLPDLTAQLLIYPVTDCRAASESYDTYADGFGLTAAGMHWFCDHYLQGGDPTDQMASPLMAESLEGVAPAFVALAECDVLYSEGAAYADRLSAAGPCVTETWPGQIHGFVSMRGIIPEGDEAVNALIRAWARYDTALRPNLP